MVSIREAPRFERFSRKSKLLIRILKIASLIHPHFASTVENSATVNESSLYPTGIHRAKPGLSRDSVCRAGYGNEETQSEGACPPIAEQIALVLGIGRLLLAARAIEAASGIHIRQPSLD
jgi:hypothetical protein